jgi:hypothetical protein
MLTVLETTIKDYPVHYSSGFRDRYARCRNRRRDGRIPKEAAR